MLLAHSGHSHQQKETVTSETPSEPIEEAIENISVKDNSNSQSNTESLTIPEIVTPTEPESISFETVDFRLFAHLNRHSSL